jgi:anti-anti-sigma factor
MDATLDKGLHINVQEHGDAATIALNGRFVFNAHHSFKDAYSRLLNNSAIHSIAIDFAEVQYLDSSALGMLLVLKDKIHSSNKSITLSRPSPIVRQVFDIANFHQVFSIQ